MRGAAMDFLEGFLLGPIWSDTEYETRNHTGFYWLIGWLTCAVFIWMLVFPDKIPEWLNLPQSLPILLAALIALISPFASRYYYRMNILVKFLILLIQLLKFCLAFLGLFQYLLPKIKLDLAALPQDILEFINKTIAKTTDYFGELGEGLGMLLGIISGGLLIVLVFAGGLLAASLVPVLYLALLKLIQRCIDMLARLALIREVE